ncbi:MAG TPA: DUF2842 domain-containing protein [Rhizomicrobium sp.]|jgi:hypothetical protein|nr:DUF2842 domain-containing protein [Rhizomicrobium sp.]
MALRPHTKKLIGAIVIVIWLPIYALLAMALAVRVLPHAHMVVQFLYYAVVGIAWILPIGLMLPWMSRDERLRERAK